MNNLTPLDNNNNNNNNNYIQFGITVLPTPPTTQPDLSITIPAKLLSILKKYKYNWRIEQLSKPHYRKHINAVKQVGLIDRSLKPPPRLTDEIKYYSDQMSRPKLKDLYFNRINFAPKNKKLEGNLNKNISRTWESIYMYYKRKERDRRLRMLRMQKPKRKAFEPNLERYNELAKPKPAFQQPPIRKLGKIFSNYEHLTVLAKPKVYYLEPIKNIEAVSPAALTYEATENVIRLAQLPARFLNVPLPIDPEKVKPGALRYKITQRVDELAIPKKRVDRV